MKILWISGLPESLRVKYPQNSLCCGKLPAWGWVLGHLPPPQNIDLHILCSVRNLIRDEVHFDYEGAHWHCFRESRLNRYLLRVPMFLKVRGFVSHLHPDVVAGWGAETGNGWLAFLLSRKAVVHVQGVLPLLVEQMAKYGLRLNVGRWVDVKLRDLVNFLTFKLARHFTVESRLAQDAVLRIYGKESQIIYQPLRKEFLEHNHPVVHNDHPVFLYVGEFINRKGTLDTLMAFAELKDKTAQLRMVGAGVQRDEAHAFVRENGLQDRVAFYESLSSQAILDLIDTSDFFILPSYGDTGPTALKEALSQGLYPVCYDNTGPKELIERYAFGSVGKTGDWKSLVPLMQNAVEGISQLAERGCSVAMLIKRDLLPTSIWPQLLEFYRGTRV